MQTLPKILFVGDKWCAGNQKFGIAEWENNLYTSLLETGLAQADTFHFDEYFINNQKVADEAFVEKIKEYQPDFICSILYKMPGSDINVPTWETFSKIKNDFKIPIVAIWGDLENAKQVKISKALDPYITLHLATAALSAVKKMGNPEKYVYMWVPKNPKIFNDPFKKRDIPFSYVGTPKLGRLKIVNHLNVNGISIEHEGGERERHLTTEEYADKFQRSKITLSFARASDSHVINARPFEAMLCGAMVLEEASIEAPRLYTPFVDYVPFFNKKDLLKKTNYYLENDVEREKIAQNGFKKTSELYSAHKFWQFTIDRVLKNDLSSPYTGEALRTITAPDLSRLPKIRTLQLKFLWRLCSNKIGFMIYLGTKKIFNWKYYRSLAYKILLKIIPNIKKFKQ